MKNKKFMFPLYYKDLTQSTMYWTDEEFGAYMRLLIQQWDEGFLPDDLKRLKRIAESITPDHLALTKFIKADKGKLINERLEDIRTNYVSFSKKQKDNGLRGGRPKVTQSKTQSKTQIETQTQTQTVINDKPKQKPLIKSKNKDKDKDKSKLEVENKSKSKSKSKSKRQSALPEKKIPTIQEFLLYCKQVLKDKYEPYDFSLRAKYDTFVADGWKDGNGSDIKNWQTKIRNVIPHLKPMGSVKTNNKDETVANAYTESL